MVSCGSSAVLLLLVVTAVLASPLDYVLESQVQGVLGRAGPIPILSIGYHLSADTAGLQIRADTKKLSDTFI
jgi:hypothetical protein